MSEEKVVDTQQEQTGSTETSPKEEKEYEGFIVDGVEEEEKSAEEATEEAEKQEDQPPAKKVSKAEKRIKKLLADKYALLEEKERLARELEALKQPEPRQATRTAKSVDDLDPEDFDTFEDYLAAVEELEEVEEEEPQEREPKEQSPPVDKEYAIAMEELNYKFTELKDDLPEDFVETVLDEKLPITPDMVVALNELDNPHEVAYYLGKHPDKTAEIAQLPPKQQIAAIVRLGTSPKKTITTTKAPKPLDPVGGSEMPTEDPSTMSFSEYEKWAAKQEQKENDWL